MDNAIFHTNYLVTGPTGTGKTYWAREQYNKALEIFNKERESSMLSSTEAVIFESYPDLCVAARSYRNAEDIIKRMKYAYFLVLDDLWGSPVTGFDIVAYIVINYRLEKGKATIVTTNMKLNEIGAIDDRLASRLSSYERKKFTGADRRNSK